MEWKTSNEPVDYQNAVSYMEMRASAIRKGTARELIWLLEHNSIFTAGSSANSLDMLDNKGLMVYKTGRGGQYTYHGPGQRIAYIMLDLKKHGGDIHLFIKNVENSIINALAAFGVQGMIREGRVGVWVQDGDKEAKIAAIGVRLKQWVTYHGIAVNIRPDLHYYDGIIPCGIKEYGITSLHKLGIHITLSEFDEAFKQAFVKIFG